MSRLVLVGAGPVGLAAARAALEDGVVEALAVVVDPAVEARRRATHELGAGRALPGLDELDRAGSGDRAVVTFSSRAEAVLPAILRLLGAGYHAVTTCEELADPSPEDRATLVAASREAGRSVIATGANPGFVMDRLPLLLAAAVRRVRRVEVVRRLDTRERRGPLQEKTGYGLTTDEFARGVTEGRLGHVGLEVSARLLAEGMGWPSAEVQTTIEAVEGAQGRVAGLHQTATLETSQGSIFLDLTMAWGVDEPLDRITIDADPPLRAEILGGYHGDLGTTAQVVSALRQTSALEPDFYRPTDLPLHW